LPPAGDPRAELPRPSWPGRPGWPRPASRG